MAKPIHTLERIAREMIFILGEEQTCCPFCGTRTAFADLKPTRDDGARQLHVCDTEARGCGAVFMATER